MSTTSKPEAFPYIFIRATVDKTGATAKLFPLAGQYLETKGIMGTNLVKVNPKKIVQVKIPSHELTDGFIFAVPVKDLLEKDIFFEAKSYQSLDSKECPVSIKNVYKQFKKSLEDVAPASGPRKTSFLDKIISNPKFAVPTIEADGFYIPEDTWYFLLRNIKQQRPTLIVGPSGTGKTELISILSKKLELPLVNKDMGTMIDPISSLCGTHRAKAGNSVFEFAPFVREIQEPCVMLLDELSRAPASSNNILLPLLDSRRTLRVEIAGDDDPKEFKAHIDCSFVATANIGAEFSGTNSLDRALVDRFTFIEVGHLEKDIEAKVISKRTGISLVDAETISAIANDIRELYKNNEISNNVSIRHTLEIGELVKDGFGIEKASELILFPLFDNSDVDSERATIKNVLVNY